MRLTSNRYRYSDELSTSVRYSLVSLSLSLQVCAHSLHGYTVNQVKVHLHWQSAHHSLSILVAIITLCAGNPSLLLWTISELSPSHKFRANQPNVNVIDSSSSQLKATQLLASFKLFDSEYSVISYQLSVILCINSSKPSSNPSVDCLLPYVTH